MDAKSLGPRFAPSSRLSTARFLTYSGEEIKKISCKKVTNPNTFDSLLHPNIGGLYDPALGPCGKDDACGTCGLNYVHCPGHMGHIPLPLPVYHPIFFMSLYQVLRGSCWNCHRWLCTTYKAHLLKGQLELLSFGLLTEALELESVLSSAAEEIGAGIGDDSPDSVIQSIAQYVENCTTSVRRSNPSRTKILVELKRQLVADFLKACSGGASRKCPHCSAPVRTVKQEHHIRVFLKGLSRKQASSWVAAWNREIAGMREQEPGLEDANSGDGSAVQTEIELTDIQTQVAGDTRQGFITAEECMKQSYVSPLKAREHVKKLWVRERMLMGVMFGCGLEGVSGLEDMFFLDVVPVPPSRFRPVSFFCFFFYRPLTHCSVWNLLSHACMCSRVKGMPFCVSVCLQKQPESCDY